jgi:hypothetical protein
VTLGDFYRESGESAHLLRVEGALAAGWAASRDVAAAASVSVNFARKALAYLLEEGRVERRRADDPAYRPHGWRWEWRSPS